MTSGPGGRSSSRQRARFQTPGWHRWEGISQDHLCSSIVRTFQNARAADQVSISMSTQCLSPSKQLSSEILSFTVASSCSPVSASVHMRSAVISYVLLVLLLIFVLLCLMKDVELNAVDLLSGRLQLTWEVPPTSPWRALSSEALIPCCHMEEGT